MENDILISHALDLARRCREDYVVTSTPFCDMAQRSLLSGSLKGCGARFEFFGGYGDAERTVCVFLPDYIDDMESFFADSPDECPIEVIRCTSKKGSPPLSHRDYLGSLMALGIKREKIGDIIVVEGGADIVILKETEKFLLSEYKSAGRVNFDTVALPVNKITAPKIKTESVRGSVASARLDNLISEAFSLSRDAAAQAVEAGLVFVNEARATKPDAKISEGAKIVLRGHGKVIFREVAGQTRRGRLSVIFEKYV